jgi:hypothetical protein
MKNITAIICAITIFCSCSARAEEKCGGSDLKYYNQAIAFQLAKRGVPSRISGGDMVCVAEKHAAAFTAAENSVDHFFHEVAYNPKDACEERALVEWATRERLRFDVRPTTDMRDQPAGNLFFLRSFTQEEVVSNSEKLAKNAPKGSRCKPMKSAH